MTEISVLDVILFKLIARPETMQGLFNLCHSSARNDIERAFGVCKNRFPILRTGCQFPIQTQSAIALVCCLLHNYIRTAKRLVENGVFPTLQDIRNNVVPNYDMLLDDNRGVIEDGGPIVTTRPWGDQENHRDSVDCGGLLNLGCNWLGQPVDLWVGQRY